MCGLRSGSVLTKLGKPQPGNGTLELKGDDSVEVAYIDEQTADKQFNRKLLHKVTVVGNALLSINDGAFKETLRGVVLGKTINLQIIDADRDLTDAADTIKAAVEVVRPKTDEEIENELVELKKSGKVVATDDDGEPKIEKFKKVDRIEVTLTEVKVENQFEKKPAGDDATEAKTSATIDASNGIRLAGGVSPPVAAKSVDAPRTGRLTPPASQDTLAGAPPTKGDDAKKVGSESQPTLKVEDNSIHSGCSE